MLAHALACIEQCRALALHTEQPGSTTRTFLSEPMRAVHRDLTDLMRRTGMEVSIDAAGNLRGVTTGDGPALLMGSHLDTVPDAGAFDGILGVVMAIKLVELLRPTGIPVHVIGFSEEEGVRFGFPFIGSLAVAGGLGEAQLERRDKQGQTVRQAIEAFGLDADQLHQAAIPLPAAGYLEFHIEQGPLLESRSLPLAVVEGIAGQSRLSLAFEGSAGHAGTTPMHLRRDALQGAAEWIGAVERKAQSIAGLVATVGRIEVLPGAPNVIAGSASVSLDVRHTADDIRHAAVSALLEEAARIAARRGLTLQSATLLDQPSVSMDAELSGRLAAALARCGYQPFRMPSGAGHDAMVLARVMPAAMLFLRSPGGISHHPAEAVLPEDVAAALETGLSFLKALLQDRERAA